jgi:PKHD-type hydroxylase
MKQFYTRQILTEEQILNVKNVISEADNNELWQNGLNSGGGFSRVKNNLEMSNAVLISKINSMIMNSLDSDNYFINFTAAKETTFNIISKTISGGYYNPHYDQWKNGDYSTTVFLNDPEEYGGGELCLYVGGEDEIKIKLKSGWGVTYPTGVLHRVNRVTTGTRYASVFWTKSLIEDHFIRHIYSEICDAKNNMVKYESPIHLANCLNVSKDPCFILEGLRQQILRRYAK